MTRRSFPIVLLLLSACGASHTQLSRDTFAIECRRSRSNCYERAAEVCPDGFRVMDSDSQRGAIVNTYNGSATVTPTYKGELLVRCEPEAAAADREAKAGE